MDTQQAVTRNTDLKPNQAVHRILTGEPVAADHEALYQTALTAVNNRGWSVIPILGDLAHNAGQGKRAAVNWTEFQQRLATPDELRYWFIDRGYPGLAVVCGDISQLAVIDCDSPELAEAFAAELPDFLDTYTVLSAQKGLPHFYYRPPVGVDLRFRGRKGTLELRGNGNYVVTYPTIIQGNPYRLLRGGPLLELTSDQWMHLLGFVDRHTGNNNPNRPAPDQSSIDTPVSHQKLRLSYRDNVQKHNSRNEGLFRTACLARDSGWSVNMVFSLLVPEHLAHVPLGVHPTETPDLRRAEAERTILSAFSRPPHARRSGCLFPPGLPTNVREHLLQTKQASLARILDTLLLHGVFAGDIISQPDIVRLCTEHGIGHATVKTVLKDTTALRLVCVSAITSDARLVSVQTLNENSMSGNLVSILHSNKRSGTYCVSKGENPRLNAARGRTPKFFAMLDVAELCREWDITDTGSDPLLPDALRSTKAYRQAVNAALIKRRSDQYSKKWLARRVGVTSRTMHAYLKDDTRIKITQQVARVPVTANNVGVAVPDLEPGEQWRHWLEDETGKRYPPVREIAQKLLGWRHTVTFCTQQCNHYTYVESAENSQSQTVRT